MQWRARRGGEIYHNREVGRSGEERMQWPARRGGEIYHNREVGRRNNRCEYGGQVGNRTVRKSIDF
jgi:hypothetical protein